MFKHTVEHQLLIELNNRIHKFSSDSIITYSTLIKIDLEDFERKNKVLNSNIIKNPYIDLTMKTHMVLLIILILPILIYFYFSLIIKYYAKLEKKIETYNITDAMKTPSLKNVNVFLGFLPFSERSGKIVTTFFYTLLPLAMIGFFTNYLYAIYTFEFLLVMSFIILLRLLLWTITDHRSKLLRSFSFNKRL